MKKILGNTISLTRRAGLTALLAVAATGLTGVATGHAADKAIKVGIISGEDEDVWREVTKQAAKSGLKIETIIFNDYTRQTKRWSAARSTPTPSSTSHTSTIRSSSMATRSYQLATPVYGQSGFTPRRTKLWLI